MYVGNAHRDACRIADRLIGVPVCVRWARPPASFASFTSPGCACAACTEGRGHQTKTRTCVAQLNSVRTLVNDAPIAVAECRCRSLLFRPHTRGPLSRT